MPAYNESKVISKVIKYVKEKGFNNILVVDDCSSDNTYKEAKNSGAIVLRHILNRGAGGATATGLEYAKRENFEFVVMIDSDGQHDINDIDKLLKFTNKYDVIIGSRMIGNIEKMPIQRKIANFVGSIFTWFFFGKFVFDSQSGFKIFNKKAIDKINITFDRYEFCSEVIGEIGKHKLSVKEVPIKVIYSNHSMGKVQSGQSISNGFKMILKFLFK